MKKVKRTERGWAGHFICAQDCFFRRNTLVELGNVSVVVSTVGLMRRQVNGEYEKPQEIGYDRFYETMSFMADDSVYRDANVSLEINPIDTKWRISGKEMKEQGDSIDNVANDMHENYVNVIEKMLINGEIE